MQPAAKPAATPPVTATTAEPTGQLDPSLHAHLRSLTCAQRLRLNDRALRAALKLRAAFGHANR